MDYAEALALKFAYSTNGHGIIEHDYITGKQAVLDAFPSPETLWQRVSLSNSLTAPARKTVT